MINMKLLAALFLLTGLASQVESAEFCNGASAEADQILADVLAQLQIGSINSDCVPIYRLDLPPAYIAYYIVYHDDGYLLVSAGEKTCDRDLVIDSNGTSPAGGCDATAQSAGKSCGKYYLLSDAGEMICKDSDGFVVGYNLPAHEYEHIIKQFGDLDKFVKKRAKKIAKEFAKRCKSREKELEKDVDKPQGKNAVGIQVLGKVPGDSITIVFASDVDKVSIVYLSENSSADMSAALSVLCADIADCQYDSDNNEASIPSSAHLSNPARVVIKIADDADDATFEVKITYSDGSEESKYYEIMNSPPAKRGWNQFVYFSFSYCYASSYYPKYCPFYYGSCYVGVIPYDWYIGGAALAWGHVFGMYDRSGKCTCLYNSGLSGVYGSCSTVAPYYMDTTRMIYHLVYLRALLLSSCPSGGTSFAYMTRVASHYWSRCRRLIYQYTSNIDYYVYHWVCLGRPVIVLVRMSSGRYEYPVAIAARRRVIYYRYCYYWLGIYLRCGTWSYYYDYDYYLRFNWCGSYDGWYNMANYRAYVAS